jgi:hypothetical protein
VADPLCIEAPSAASAIALVTELAWLEDTDLVPIDDDRWEVRVDEPGNELGRVLTIVEQWVVVWNLGSAVVRISGTPHTLSPADPRPRA